MPDKKMAKLFGDQKMKCFDTAKILSTKAGHVTPDIDSKHEKIEEENGKEESGVKSNYTKEFKLSKDLAKFIGKEQASRQECIKLFWAHIKKCELQDPENKLFFTPDEKMAKLFGNQKMKCTETAKILSVKVGGHLTPLETDLEIEPTTVKGSGKGFGSRNNFTNELNLSEDLAEFIGKHQATRQECNKIFWTYIKQNELRDPKDNSFFTPDKKMAKLFGDQRMKCHDMAKILSTKNGHTPLEVDFEIEPTTEKGRSKGFGGRNNLTNELKLSEDLAEFIGKNQATRQECNKLFWAYIKQNELRDPKDKTFFTPDKKMAKLFGDQRMKCHDMAKILSTKNGHMIPLNQKEAPLVKSKTQQEEQEEEGKEDEEMEVEEDNKEELEKENKEKEEEEVEKEEEGNEMEEKEKTNQGKENEENKEEQKKKGTKEEKVRREEEEETNKGEQEKNYEIEGTGKEEEKEERVKEGEREGEEDNEEKKDEIEGTNKEEEKEEKVEEGERERGEEKEEEKTPRGTVPLLFALEDDEE